MGAGNSGSGGVGKKVKNRSNRASPNKWPNNDALKAIIFRNSGVTSKVADAVKMDIRTIQLRIKRDDTFRQWFEEARERMVDMAESVIFKALKKNNMTAAIFTLKCHAKQRGWVERHEITGADGRGLFDPLIAARRMSDGVRVAIADPETRKRLVDAHALVESNMGGNEVKTDEEVLN